MTTSHHTRPLRHTKRGFTSALSPEESRSVIHGGHQSFAARMKPSSSGAGGQVFFGLLLLLLGLFVWLSFVGT